MNLGKYLILGASSEMCTEFIRRHVWRHDDEIVAQYFRNKDELSELKKNIPAEMKLFPVDFSSEEDTKNFSEQLVAENFIPTHILHSPAIPMEILRFNETTRENFEMQLNVQCLSLVTVLNKLIKPMSREKRGKIVLILSSCSINVPPKFLSAYVTAKYALLGLGKSLAAEYAPKNIQVNMISPSMTETKFLKNLHESVIEKSAGVNPMKRNATPADTANVIEFLFSDNNSFMTGANIPVTGGEEF